MTTGQRRPTSPRAETASDMFAELTDRERQILTLVADHHTNPEIARRLQLRPKTVRNHVSNIFTKLQVSDRAPAIIRAQDAGMGQTDRDALR